jgi:7-cyano-7-deazaguanine synthase
MAKHVVVSLSGGMDSSTLLLRCLKEYDTVTALSFDYGQKHRVEGGAEVPEGHYAEDNMKATVVPNRNKIFASITQAVALSIADKTGEMCDIAMGIHAGDHAIYPDCRQEFRDADDYAFRVGNWGAENVSYWTPYLVNFDEVYSRTNTSYKPMQHNKVWYSDYKSASSVERVEAFIKLGRPDPVEYADETGPITWEHVVDHVSQVLSQHNSPAY